jgi:hypothetical protein
VRNIVHTTLWTIQLSIWIKATDIMGPEYTSKHEWELPIPRTPIVKPNWKRGQEGGTAIRISMPQDPPLYEVKVPTERLRPSKRSYFKAFDAVDAQDAALVGQTISYDHDIPRHPRPNAKERRDSIQDDHSNSTDSLAERLSRAPDSALPTNSQLQPPAIVLTTEPAISSEDSAVHTPRELKIDGNAGFDSHRPENTNTPPKRTYLYQGKRYEVLGNEPEEWLKDVREVTTAPSRASVSSTRGARLNSRSSIAPNTMVYGSTARTRRSQRASPERPDDAGRRRSGRIC